MRHRYPDTEHFELPNGQAAFATRRFDRQQDMRVPMQSLAVFTGADFRAPGALDYTNLLRATQYCCNDVRMKAAAFERIVFNVVFNNRDDHPKNFAYLMSPNGQWKLAAAYDVTFCEGPSGYQQMDVMGEALHITRKHLLTLAVEAFSRECRQHHRANLPGCRRLYRKSQAAASRCHHPRQAAHDPGAH